MPYSLMKLMGPVPGSSKSTPTTRTPSARYFLHVASRSGASARHGSHQDAQKLITTGAPFSSLLDRVPPPTNGSVNEGATSPWRARGVSVRISPTARTAMKRPGTTTNASSGRVRRTRGDSDEGARATTLPYEGVEGGTDLARRESAFEAPGDDAPPVDQEEPGLGLQVPLLEGRAGDLLFEGLGLVVEVDLGMDEDHLPPEVVLDGDELVQAGPAVARLAELRRRHDERDRLAFRQGLLQRDLVHVAVGRPRADRADPAGIVDGGRLARDRRLPDDPGVPVAAGLDALTGALDDRQPDQAGRLRRL